MFKNVKNFIEWLKRVSKEEVDDVYIKWTLEDVRVQHHATGTCVYELSRLETKSGNPETYTYTDNLIENGDRFIIEYIF